MFNRSFVLHYARYLGLDEARVAADYDSSFGASAIDMREVASQRKERTVPAERDWSFLDKLQPLRGVLLGVLVTAILVGAGLTAVRRGWAQAAWVRISSFTARLHQPATLPPAAPATQPPASMAASQPAQSGALPAPDASSGTAAQALTTPSQSGLVPPAGVQPSAAPSPGPVGGRPVEQPAGVEIAGARQNAAEAGARPSARPGTVQAEGLLPLRAPARASTLGGEQQPVVPAPLVLQIDTPNQTAWVEVRADGKRQWSGDMRAGESRVVKAFSNIQLRTGNASAVILTLNGETQPPLGSPGEVKTANFTLQDVKKP